MALRDPNQTYTYKIFGKNITLPKGFKLAPGVSINQNKKMFRSGDDIPTSTFSEMKGPIRVADME